MKFNRIYNSLINRAKKYVMVSLPKISGVEAYKYAQMNCSIRQRYSGSINNRIALEQIEQVLRQNNIQYYIDTFIADSPNNKIRFNNLVVDIKGKSDKYIIIGCHHDTKLLPQKPQFSGANDGASGVGLLLNLIIHFSQNINYILPYGIKFIFFDGEQSIYSYTKNDGLQGSKYAAKKYYKNCLYMILLDMIGYKDLYIKFPVNSNDQLVQLTQKIIQRLDYRQYFDIQRYQNSIIDDTKPFEKYNVSTINFIQMEYPYWHTNGDTFDKLSINSFKVIGNTVIQLIKQLQNI